MVFHWTINNFEEKMGVGGRKLILIIDLIFDRLKMGGLGDVVKSSKSMLCYKIRENPIFFGE